MTNPRLVVLAFLSLALSGPWASANAPAGRYTVSSGVVTDTRTRLSWQQTAPTGALTQSAASASCQSLGTGWRMPTFKELTTIVDFTRTAPAIDTTVFLGTQSAAYWSMTFLVDTSNSWGINFSDGGALIITASTAFVRCVRWNG